MLEPVPPRVKLGRTTQGRPISCTTRRASSRLLTVWPRRHFQADPLHGRLELVARFGLGDHRGVGADHLDAVLLQHAVMVQVHRQVQARLAAEGGQQGVGPLGLDHLGDDLPGQRLDVGAVGHLRVGHDRGRVGVDQHDLVPLLAEGLAGLGARIIELAGLPDDDRARSRSAGSSGCRCGVARRNPFVVPLGETRWPPAPPSRAKWNGSEIL